MQKLSRRLYKRIMGDALMSTNKLHFLFFLTSVQRPDGWVYGVYYKDVADKVGCSISDVYVIRDYLKDAGYIDWTKSAAADMDIRVNDNVYQYSKYVAPDYQDYINLNISLFDDREFWRLPVGAVKTALYWLNCLGGQQANPKIQDKDKLWSHAATFVEDIIKTVQVTARTAKKYLKLLTVWFNIGISDRISRLKDVVSLKKDPKNKPVYALTEKGRRTQSAEYPERRSYVQYIRMVCRRLRVQYDEDSLNDTADLIRQYLPKLQTDKDCIYVYMGDAIKAGGGVLSSKSVHSIIRSRIQAAF